MSDDGVSLGQAKVIRASEKALLVQADAYGEIWIPKSVIHDDSEVDGTTDRAEGKLVVFEWWASKQNLV